MRKALIVIMLFLCAIAVNAIPIREYHLSLGLKPIVQMESLAIDVKDSSGYEWEPDGEFRWELRDQDKVLNYSHFEGTEHILYDTADPVTGEINGGGELDHELDRIDIYMPYEPAADHIVILRNGTTVADIDVSMFEQKSTGLVKKPQQVTPKPEAQEPPGHDSSTTYAVLAIAVCIIVFVALMRRRRK